MCEYKKNYEVFSQFPIYFFSLQAYNANIQDKFFSYPLHPDLHLTNFLGENPRRGGWLLEDNPIGLLSPGKHIFRYLKLLLFIFPRHNAGNETIGVTFVSS